jgi:siroheme synthase
LKSGDPFVFGRGGEEVDALAAAGVPFEIVPGITTAFVAPALAGIPVTHRGVASAVVVVSGHSVEGYGPALESLAPGAATIVVLMGVGERRRIGKLLVRCGWRPSTPAALVVNASRRAQHVWRGTLADLGTGKGGAVSRDEPGVIVVGDVVRHARPGKTIPAPASRTARGARND